MAHKRKQIRQALKDLLSGTAPTHPTGAADRIYTNLSFTKEKGKLPYIHLQDGSETPTPRDQRTSIYVRKFQVEIEVKVSDSENVDQLLDDLCTQIETLINNDRTLGGVCSASLYLGTEPPIFEPGEKTIGSTTITYEFHYFT